ncbi:hypothetical protein [Citrobacter freundii]|uniref:hypothetical protein n=1 Tax=Citrobacter freundii TaxID=546 RepID=UPI003C6F6D8D
MKDKLNINILIFAVAVISLVMVREFWLFSRTNLHVDESMSFAISSYSDYGFDKTFPGFFTTTGDNLRHEMWFHDKSFSGMLSDVKKLWIFNRDTPHSNLYYSLLRIWFTGVSSDNTTFTLNWAIQLNILLFIASISLFFCLIKKTTKSYTLAIIGSLISFSNTGAISNTIFARPYQIQETMFIAFALFSYIYYTSTQKNSKLTVAYGIVTAITILTGYFAILFVFLMLIFILINEMLTNKNIKDIIKRALIYIATTLTFCIIIYPPYFFVGGERHSQALGKAEGILSNIKSAFYYIPVLDKYYPLAIACTIFFIVAFSFILIKYKNWNSHGDLFLLITVLISTLWVIVVLAIAPYKTQRYIYASLPFFSIPYIIAISRVKGKALIVSGMFILSSSIINSLHNPPVSE